MLNGILLKRGMTRIYMIIYHKAYGILLKMVDELRRGGNPHEDPPHANLKVLGRL